MEKPAYVKKKKGASKPKIELSEEEKALMKMLGLKQKDLLALKESVEETETEVEETGDLFKDPTFEEEEE